MRCPHCDRIIPALSATHRRRPKARCPHCGTKRQKQRGVDLDALVTDIERKLGDGLTCDAVIAELRARGYPVLNVDVR